MRRLRLAALALAGFVALLAAAAAAIGIRGDIAAETLMARYAGPESRFVAVDGLNVHYRDRGPREGPVLVLLHGSSASLHTWEGWTARLGDAIRVVSLDLPAHGLTGPYPEGGDYSAQAYAEFLDRFVNALDLQRFALGGNSMGGGIAVTYAARHPQKVERLILIAAAVYPHPEAGRLSGFLRWPGAEAAIRWFTPRFLVGATVRRLYGAPEKVDEALIDRYGDLLRRAGNRGALLQRVRQTRFDPALLAQLHLPVLIQWGGRDPLILPADAFRLQNDIADARLAIYSEAGHMPMEEVPDPSAADARAFLLGR